MLRLPSRSPTELAIALALGLGATGCSDDACGPGGAPSAGLLATGDAVNLSYGGLTGGPNNDCPSSDAPAGVVSLTIHGSQTNGTGSFTLCVGRPDLLTHQALALGLDTAGSPVRVIEATATATGCSFAVDPSQPVTGTASTTGLCSNGASRAGFALVVDGALTLTRTCGATITPVAVSLRGRVAVAPM